MAIKENYVFIEILFQFHILYSQGGGVVALSPGPSHILSRSHGEKSGEGLGWPSPDFSPRLQDKIWEWPRNEARGVVLHNCTVVKSLNSNMSQ